MAINSEKISSAEIFQIVKDVTIQIFALFGADNFLLLFPRPDLRGFDYVPQLFFVKPKNQLISRGLIILAALKDRLSTIMIAKQNV